MHRRKFLAVSSAVTTGMLAGCGLPGGEEDEDDGEGGDGGEEAGEEEEENEERLARPN